MLEDPNASWDVGGPRWGSGAIMGFQRTIGYYGMLEDCNASWGVGGPMWGYGAIMGF